MPGFSVYLTALQHSTEETVLQRFFLFLVKTAQQKKGWLLWNLKEVSGREKSMSEIL